MFFLIQWNLWVVVKKTFPKTHRHAALLHHFTSSIFERHFFFSFGNNQHNITSFTVPDKPVFFVFVTSVLFTVSADEKLDNCAPKLCDVTQLMVNAHRVSHKTSNVRQKNDTSHRKSLTVWCYSLPLAVAAASVGGLYSSGNFMMSVKLWPIWKAKSQLSLVTEQTLQKRCHWDNLILDFVSFRRLVIGRVLTDTCWHIVFQLFVLVQILGH